MNKRLLSVLVFALAVSSAASFLIYRLISNQLDARAAAPTGKIVVAARDLENGALIKDGDVKVADWTGPIPQGVVSLPEDAIGRGVLQPIFNGEPVVETRLAGKGAGAGLAATIPVGMRAVAVRVNDIVGIAGFIPPGTHVDVLIAGNPPGQTGRNVGTVTKTLLQNVEVLSAGQNIQKDNEGKPVTVGVVNMLVTPEQAEILSLASNETRIQLVLRNPTDREITKTKGTAIAYLFNGGVLEEEKPKAQIQYVPRRAAPAPAPPPPQLEVQRIVVPITVEVYHGAARAEARFKNEDNEKK